MCVPFKEKNTLNFSVTEDALYTSSDILKYNLCFFAY